MNTWNDLVPHTFDYNQLLYKISHYAIGSEIQIGYLEYECNRALYEKAVEEGYILKKTDGYTAYIFLVVKLPIDEDFINRYYI